ncbi:MAG: ParB/RepB/Spo0J family partition protein [Gammaproteobacteria bacterium]|nr:ParB/RepB/Spo0J family partition protein [Gammaproteobacteria bacterium]
MTPTKKPRLGRGLDALLGEAADTPTSEFRELPVDALRRGQYQPRTRMDDASLSDLAQSIKAQGVVQPIVARELATDGYEIIAGERRWRAAQMAGLERVPVLVRRIPDEAALAISLIENIQRENLNPIEQAGGFRRLLDEFGLTHQQIANGIGRSRAAVTNLLRLLTLNPGPRRLLEEGRIEMGHGRALLGLNGPDQDLAANHVVAKGLSVRQTEEMVRRRQGHRVRKKPRTVAPADPDVKRLEERLAASLGAKVAIIQQGAKNGRLVIEYHSLDELDGIVERLL